MMPLLKVTLPVWHRPSSGAGVWYRSGDLKDSLIPAEDACPEQSRRDRQTGRTGRFRRRCRFLREPKRGYGIEVFGGVALKRCPEPVEGMGERGCFVRPALSVVEGTAGDGAAATLACPFEWRNVVHATGAGWSEARWGQPR